jgi:hypothetical protein
VRAWFLRVTCPAIDRESIRAARLAPILFRKIPLADLHIDMSAGEINRVVNSCYQTESPHARYQYAGTLRRFLSDSKVGDVVGIRVNKEPTMIFGRFAEGDLQLFPRLENENIKGRPLELLADHEQDEMSKGLPESVKSYIGTFCNWFSGDKPELELPENEIDIPDASENKTREFYSATSANRQKQVKFIRVGADLGCGHRLSRIFLGNYYHFIPIPQHNDPEFCRFTYGDVVSRQPGKVQTKGRSLMSLREGDMLVFYAGFESEGQAPERRLVGIFAFFVVKEAFVFIPAKKKAIRFSDQSRDFDPFTQLTKANPARSLDTWKELWLRYGNWNQHLLDLRSERMDVIICGDRQRSKLLPKVEVLEEFDAQTKQYVVRPETAQKWGLTQGHDLRMSPVRTANPGIADEVFERLLRLESAKARTLR